MTGASGTLGRVVVPALTAAGHDVRPMSSRPRAGWAHADLATGAGLAAAVAGVHTVVHLASVPGGGRRTARVDVEGTRRLLAAAGRAGVAHVLYVSIVGVDRVPLPYYRAKLAAERVVAGGPVPWSVLRATQFHEFVDQLLRKSATLGPLVLDRRMRVQPVATADVAARLAAMVGAGAAGAVGEFGGPEVMTVGDGARRWQRARGTHRPQVPIRLPGGFGRAVRDGGLCTTATPTGTGTFDEYLAGAYRAARA